MVLNLGVGRIKMIRARHHVLIQRGIIKDEFGLFPDFMENETSESEKSEKEDLTYSENEYIGNEDEKDFEFVLDLVR